MASTAELSLRENRTPSAIGNPAKSSRSTATVRSALRAIEQAFKQPFSLLDLRKGELTHAAADWLNCDLYSRLALCEETARQGRPEVLDEFSPLLMLAIPMSADSETADLLAVSTFLTQSVASVDQISAAAHAFGVDAEQAFRWSRSRMVWHTHGLMQLSTALTVGFNQRQQIVKLKTQLGDVSSHLFHSFEELSLLHRLTDQLSLSHSATELCEMAAAGLAEVVSAESVVARLLNGNECHKQFNGPEVGEGLIVCKGKCPIAPSELATFIGRLGPTAREQWLVLNRESTESPTWFYPEVSELVCVPIRLGDRLLGHLLAFNRAGSRDDLTAEFSDVEVNLMASVAAIVGIHAGNIGLYREQAEFFSSVVRALSSAIDAKDPYTCGHSERVARIAVCLARHIGCASEQLETVYLAGLLHDIGKIGIDDNVLRKPGPLSAAEYEHIKLHPELGRRILEGIKQLDQVLPVVLHHHEAWNGEGYPCGLKETETPKLARIVAVADSVDAMISDRPYRRGIPDDKLDRVLRQGSGCQWDPEVVGAFFAVRDEVRAICRGESLAIAFDAQVAV